MRRILITGANRGIGLDLTERYLARGGSLIFAACRQLDRADALQTLAAQHPASLRILRMDVTDGASVNAALDVVRAEADGLDVLVNNAGSYPGGVDGHEASTSVFGALEAEPMLEVFRVNTVAPVLLAQTALDLLRRGTEARVINMSSDAASLTRGQNGHYTYPASKTALNMFTRQMAADLRGDRIIVISLHPGWIQTDMGGQRAPRTLAETMPGVVKVIDGVTLADSGAFFNWDGTHIPW
jgi:NAD(P)-dependent dehydrogenase (short-subunit alcohol dehydrogenase family)